MYKMILSENELKQIINGELLDPFIFLGMHKIDKAKVVVRVYNPQAEKVEVIIDGINYEMFRISQEGVFEVVIESKEVKPYKLEYKYYNGSIYRVKDTYSFMPYLTEYDLFFTKQFKLF